MHQRLHKAASACAVAFLRHCTSCKALRCCLRHCLHKALQAHVCFQAQPAIKLPLPPRPGDSPCKDTYIYIYTL